MSTNLEWVERVANGVTWLNDKGEAEVISEMSLPRCDALTNWLARIKGASIEREHCAQMFLSELRPFLPEPKGFDVQLEIETWDRVPDAAPPVWVEIRSTSVFRDRLLFPITWLKRTPLYEALEARKRELLALLDPSDPVSLALVHARRVLARIAEEDGRYHGDAIAAIWSIDSAQEEMGSSDGLPTVSGARLFAIDTAANRVMSEAIAIIDAVQELEEPC